MCKPLKLVPGRDTDIIVAEKVMEWEWTIESWFDEEGLEVKVLTDGDLKYAPGWESRGDDLPAYSIGDSAWQYVMYEILTRPGMSVRITGGEADCGGFHVEFVIRGKYYQSGQSATLAFAVCIAALKVVGYLPR